MDLATLRAWIEAASCDVSPENATTLRIEPKGYDDSPLPPFFAQLSENWALFSMLPMLGPADLRPDNLSRILLAANREMRLAKFALDAEGAVILCAELPTESLDASEVADVVRRVVGYARRFRETTTLR